MALRDSDQRQESGDYDNEIGSMQIADSTRPVVPVWLVPSPRPDTYPETPRAPRYRQRVWESNDFDGQHVYSRPFRGDTMQPELEPEPTPLCNGGSVEPLPDQEIAESDFLPEPEPTSRLGSELSIDAYATHNVLPLFQTLGKAMRLLRGMPVEQLNQNVQDQFEDLSRLIAERLDMQEFSVTIWDTLEKVDAFLSALLSTTDSCSSAATLSRASIECSIGSASTQASSSDVQEVEEPLAPRKRGGWKAWKENKSRASSKCSICSADPSSIGSASTRASSSDVEPLAPRKRGGRKAWKGNQTRASSKCSICSADPSSIGSTSTRASSSLVKEAWKESQ